MMAWLIHLHAVRLLRTEILTYRRVALPLLIAFIALLSSGTGMWMRGRGGDEASVCWVYFLSYLLPATYFGKNAMLMLYMVLLLGAGHLSLQDGDARPMALKKQARAKSPVKQYWVQGFGWFVHTALLCQLGFVPLLSNNFFIKFIGIVIVAEMLILAAVPAALAGEGGELMDAIVSVHKRAFPAQIKMQAQLWSIAIATSVVWLGFVYLMVRACLPLQSFERYHARTLAIAAQMAWLVLLPLHALVSVRFVRQQLTSTAQPNQSTLTSEKTSM